MRKIVATNPDLSISIDKEFEPLNIPQQKYAPSKRESTSVLIVLTLLYVMNYMDRSVMAVVLEPMKKDLNLTDAQSGFIMTIFLAMIGLLFIPGGLLVDRWSRRKSIGIMAVFWSITTGITGVCFNFTSMVTARMLTGIGQTAFAPAGTSWLSLSFPKEKRSMIMGVFNAGIPLGNALGLILGGFIVSMSGDWRAPFYWFAIPGVLLGVITFFLPDYSSNLSAETDLNSKSSFSKLTDLLKIKTLLFAGIGYAFWVLINFGIGGWLPTLMIREYNLQVNEAGNICGIFYIVSALGAITGGVISDRWQIKKSNGRCLFALTSIFLGALAKLIFIYSIGISLPVIILLGTIDGFFCSMTTPTFFTITQDVVAPKLRATSMALTLTLVFAFGGAWGPSLIGGLSDMFGSGTYGLKMAMISILPAVLLSFLFLYISSRYYAADCEGIPNEVMVEK